MTPRRTAPPRSAVLPALALLGGVALAALPTAVAAPSRAHPTRPIVDEARAFVYAELPLLEDVRWAPCSSAALRIGPPPHPTRITTPTPWPESWNIEGLPTDSNLRLGSAHWVDEIPRQYFLAFSDTDLVRSAAEWVVLDRASTTAERASISRCTAHVKRSVPIGAATIAKGSASALVPGRVYAYRRCVEGCEAPLASDARVEELGLVTSPAQWVSSSDWGSNGTPGKDSFSRGVATVRPGTTAALVVGLPPETSPTGVLRSAPATVGADTFDVEVVWPAGGEPTLTLFAGRADGDAKQLAVPR